MKVIRPDIKVYLQPAFVICVTVLAIAGASMSMAIKKFGVFLKKEPLPLKKSFDLLDEKEFSPYNILAKPKIENEEIIKELGTEDYFQWILEDPEVPTNSPIKKILLFVTYYELPDRVPHVPEECYTGGGYQRLTTESVTFEINKTDFKREIPSRYLVFGSAKPDSWQSGAKFPVLYLFRINGEYAGSRDEARIILNKNLFRKYSYFSKVELVFNQMPVAPSRQEAVKASEKLLAVVLPVLERDYWPDW
jgi:hypothetical protein